VRRHHAHEALSAEVASAVEEEQSRQARLQSLELAVNPRTGSTTRFLAASILGAVWVVVPMFGSFAVDLAPHLEGVMSAPFALLSGLVVLAIRVRFHAQLTPLNRQLAAIISFAWLSQGAVLVTYLLVTGHAVANATPLIMGFWAFVTGLLAVTMVPQLWPMAWLPRRDGAVADAPGPALSLAGPRQRHRAGDVVGVVASQPAPAGRRVSWSIEPRR
jgi:hypothetical protein